MSTKLFLVRFTASTEQLAAITDDALVDALAASDCPLKFHVVEAEETRAAAAGANEAHKEDTKANG